MKLDGARVLVVGMARSGVAAASLLVERGANVFATDKTPISDLREAARQLEQIQVPFAQQSLADFENVDLIVVSPGVPADIEPLQRARGRGIPVIGEVELAGLLLRGPIIGITGSNGKTTTTALVGHILQHARIPSQVGGNIGTPPTAMVASSRGEQWNVLELWLRRHASLKTSRVTISPF
jgi:UDP-N-acetylmuramoylalanine--D-glutamate ligase